MASRGVNKVILVGNVGNDPEVRATANGSNIVNVSIATSEVWKDRNTGQAQEKTEWHRVVIFGKTADIAAQYVKKGSKLYVEGKLQTRKWKDQQGADRYSTEVVVDGFSGQLQFLDSRASGGSNEQQGGYGSANPYASAPPPAMPQQTAAPTPQPNQRPAAAPADAAGGFDDFDDDIPF